MNATKHLLAVGLAWTGFSSALQAADATLSKCSPLEVSAVHPLPRAGENPFMTTQRLALIENGTVPCLHGGTLEATRCSFIVEQPPDARLAVSGHWVQDAKGRRYALAGQPLALDGARKGPYIVAAAVENDTVPCVMGARSRDMAAASASEELAGFCLVETMGSSTNRSGRPLENHATIPVCTSSYPHPDGARLHSADRAAGIYCYIGQGAGLNDHNGRERDHRGSYLKGNQYCHVSWSGGVEVFVGKRPATVSYPAPGRVNPRTPIVWRPVSSVRVAN